MSTALPVHTFRTKDGGTRTMKVSKRKAIELHCTECMGWEADPKDCPSTLCALYPFRKRTQAGLRSNQEPRKVRRGRNLHRKVQASVEGQNGR